MGLEAIQYIDDFNTDWPLGTDKRRQGDDHLRGIKLGVKNSFPNITGPMTRTQATLNAIPANVGDAFAHLLPQGAIIMWDLENAAVPAGWAICNGQTVADYGVVPDMRDRFIVGAGSDYANRATGGADTKNTGDSGAHTHGGSTQAHTLTVQQIPSHSHTLAETVFVDEADVGTPIQYLVNGSGRSTGSTGGGEGHSHAITEQAAHNHSVDVRPRYFAVVFIVKTTSFVAE